MAAGVPEARPLPQTAGPVHGNSDGKGNHARQEHGFTTNKR